MSTQPREVVDDCIDALETASRSTWLERMARWGLVVRGLLYFLVAFLAVRVARGNWGARADKEGALQTVLRQPLGRVLLVGFALGFAGYALWRFVEAAVGPADAEDSTKNRFKRVGYFARGVLYSALFVSAVKLLVWSTGAPPPEQATWTARVQQWPGGTWMIGLTGAVVVGAGVYIGWRGLSGRFRKRLKSIEMGPTSRWWVTGAAVVGMAARMAVTVLIGVFLMAAATRHDPSEAVGIDGALKRLAAHSYGPALLTALALGLAAYGLYSLAEARYRRVCDG
ncbi:MAG: DUF1206 domain-containing protein [Actinomycetota bacterium]|nr:DUF1206 domain-containing protein [Actinomycetota bacterium]